MRVMVIVKTTKEAEEQNTPFGWEGAAEILREDRQCLNLTIEDVERPANSR